MFDKKTKKSVIELASKMEKLQAQKEILETRISNISEKLCAKLCKNCTYGHNCYVTDIMQCLWRIKNNKN